MRNYRKIKKEQNCNCVHCLLHILLCQKLIDRTSHSVSEKKPKPSSKLLIQDPRKTKGKNPVSINFFLFRKNQTKKRTPFGSIQYPKKTPVFLSRHPVKPIQSFESRPRTRFISLSPSTIRCKTL